MMELVAVTKTYQQGRRQVHALRGVVYSFDASLGAAVLVGAAVMTTAVNTCMLHHPIIWPMAFGTAALTFRGPLSAYGSVTAHVLVAPKLAARSSRVRGIISIALFACEAKKDGWR